MKHLPIACWIVGFGMGCVVGAAIHALYASPTEIVVTNESGRPIEVVYIEDLHTKAGQVIRGLRPGESKSVEIQVKEECEFSVEAVFPDGQRAKGDYYVERWWGMRARIGETRVRFE